MAEKKKQHYVPRFYLKNFSNDRKLINLFNIKNKSIIKGIDLEDQCQKPFLYGKNLKIENALGKIETISSQIISNIIKNNSVPMRFSEEHYSLLTYILFQYSRTLSAAKEHEELIGNIIKSFMKHRGIIQDKHIDQLEIEIEIEIENSISLPLKTIATSIHLVMDLQLQVIKNKTDISFITSDNPVIFFNQSFANVNENPNIGLASRGLQIFFPLSPNYLILFYDSEIYEMGSINQKYLNISNKNDIEEINNLQWLNALNNIYYCNQDELEVKRGADSNISKRMKEKVFLKDYYSEDSTKDNRKILTHTYKARLQTELKLQFIKQTKHNFYNGQYESTVRNIELLKLHDEFIKQHEAGKYRASEFQSFLIDISTINDIRHKIKPEKEN